jgi:hypothetical protein
MDDLPERTLICIPVAHGGGLRVTCLFGCRSASGRFPGTAILKRRPIAASSSIHLQISFLSIRFNFRISSLRCLTSIVLPILIIIIVNIMIYDYSPILLWFWRHRFYVCQSRYRPLHSVLRAESQLPLTPLTIPRPLRCTPLGDLQLFRRS